MNDLEAFTKLVQALDPWRGQLVFMGGWSHRLHTLHQHASVVYALLMNVGAIVFVLVMRNRRAPPALLS